MGGWADVEAELARLAETGEPLLTVTGKQNRIVGYVPGERVTVVTERGEDDILIEHIRQHWDTLVSRRRVTLDELLRPGNRSAFMGALFRRIEGVDLEEGRPAHLVLRQCAGR